MPTAELALPREALPEDRKKHSKKVTWIRPAPEGFAKHFIVMYTEPGQPVPDTDVEILSSFSLPDGRTVSITIFEQTVPEKGREQIEAHRRAMAKG